MSAHDFQKKVSGVSFMMPAGRYYIGDPCYVIPDDQWSEILEESKYFGMDEGNAAALMFKGFPVFAAGTAYGDGTYNDDNGNEYPVDAGMIGAIHEKHWRPKHDEPHPFGCNLVEFDRPFRVSRSESGTIRVGYIKIETD